MSKYQVTNYGMCGECEHNKRDWTNPNNPDFYCSNERSDYYGYNTDYTDTCDCFEQRGIE